MLCNTHLTRPNQIKSNQIKSLVTTKMPFPSLESLASDGDYQ